MGATAHATDDDTAFATLEAIKLFKQAIDDAGPPVVVVFVGTARRRQRRKVMQTRRIAAVPMVNRWLILRRRAENKGWDSFVAVGSDSKLQERFSTPGEGHVRKDTFLGACNWKPS